MILLERGNRILGETVSAKVNFQVDPNSEEKIEPMEVKLHDFDDVSYHVSIKPEDRNIMFVSMNMPFYHQIEKHGAKDAFDKNFGSMATSAQQGNDLSVKIDLSAAKDQKAKDDVVNKISQMKAIVLGGVFDYFFTAVLNGKTLTEPFKFDLRSDTTVYMFPRPDRCIVVFSMDFKEKVDKAIAKVFMQEFVEARRGLGAAPPCAWGVNPPMELAHYKITEPTGNLGFISFPVLKSHLDSGKKERVVASLQSFRNYMQYHIKASKSHFHQRMRARVVSLLVVLNRAKVDQEDKSKSMKTAQGKTFTRKE
jgi:actin related protein 2/3 complex subunit 2